MLTAYEGVPSILEQGQIATVLESARADTTPAGLRDHAILRLLATYRLRSGEIRNLRIEDIDWRSEIIRVRHTKTGACSFLPLMAPAGEAVLAFSMKTNVNRKRLSRSGAAKVSARLRQLALGLVSL